MDSKNVLLIHIGTPKTGTTALQRFFCANREILRRFSWSYPALKEKFSYYPTTDSDITKNGNLIFSEYERQLDNDEQRKEVWDAIRKELNYNNVILSSEEIYQGDVEAIISSAKQEYDNIKIIVYLRRQDDFIESCWKHAIKIGICYDCVQQWAKTIWINGILKVHSNYYERIKKIEKIVSKENIIVRVFEKEQFQGEWNNIASDFLKCIGIENISEFYPVSRENESYEGSILELKRIVNKNIGFAFMHDKESIKNNWFIMKNIIKINDYNKQNKQSYLTKDERIGILKYFAESNERIAREYLERESGVLFYDNNVDIPLYTVDYKDLIEKSIELMSCILLEHKQVVEKDKGGELSFVRVLEMKIQMIAEGRKVVLFGAGERCRYILEKLKITVDCIVDNNERIQGTKVKDVSVFSPSEILDKKNHVVVVTCRDYGDIVQQLATYDMIDGVDFILMSDYM